MESIQGFDFVRMTFDGDGALTNPPALDEVKARAAADATDVIFIAHGFRNSEQDATRLYQDFLTTFRAHVDGALHAALGPRKFIVAAVYWPSKAFAEAEDLGGSAQGVDEEGAAKERVKSRLEEMKASDARGDQKAKIDRAIQLLDTVKNGKSTQDEFVALILSLVEEAEPDPTEGADRVKAADGSVLLDKLKTPVILPSGRDKANDGGATSVVTTFHGGNDEGGVEGLTSGFGSIFGRIGQFLNLTTWYVMKNRSGTVGANGVAAAVRAVKKAARPEVRIHLVGHSLGGRLMAACAKALAEAPKVSPDSLTLLEAAFSHYGFSANNGKGQAGFFRAVLAERIVKGPCFETFSAQDRVVGTAYALASRLAGDTVQEVGDAHDPYGGIGRNGAQLTNEATVDVLRSTTTNPYVFPAGTLVNLDGSGGLIKDHGDVTNANVTFAFACAVSQT